MVGSQAGALQRLEEGPQECVRSEVLAGTLLLTGKFVPLALVILAPIVVNVAAFHVFLTPGEPAMAIVLTFLLAFLGWTYRSSFSGVLNPNAAPGA